MNEQDEYNERKRLGHVTMKGLLKDLRRISWEGEEGRQNIGRIWSKIKDEQLDE